MRYTVSFNTGFFWDFLIVALITKIGRCFLVPIPDGEASLPIAFTQN